MANKPNNRATDDPKMTGWLLASTAVGLLSGVALPAYWVLWLTPSHPAEPFTLPVVAGLLVISLAGHLWVGISSHRAILGAGLTLLNIVLAIVVTMTTWFLVPPCAIVGLWLLISGFAWQGNRGLDRLAVRTVACIVLFVTLGVSVLLPSVPVGRDLAASLINLALALWVAALSRSYLLIGSQSRRRIGRYMRVRPAIAENDAGQVR